MQLIPYKAQIYIRVNCALYTSYKDLRMFCEVPIHDNGVTDSIGRFSDIHEKTQYAKTIIGLYTGILTVLMWR